MHKKLGVGKTHSALITWSRVLKCVCLRISGKTKSYLET